MAPVPLPAGLPLLAVGIGVLGVIGRWKSAI
ncbi:MAG: VPLPA-CTERM sorting domain-containing protein [Pseudomonadota bacterium]